MIFELFVANRYLRSKRRTGFISLITYISILGIMIGVAALVIVLSVTNGFETEVRERIINVDAHIKVAKFSDATSDATMDNYREVADRLRYFDHVVGVSPYIQDKGMLRFGTSIEGVFFKGIDEATVDQVSDLRNTLVAGELRVDPRSNAEPDPDSTITEKSEDPLATPLFSDADPTIPGIILGAQLSFRLNAVVGDVIIAISPTGMTGMFSSPQVERLVVTGVFETGFYEYDDTYCYVSIQTAQKLFLLENAVSGIELKLDDVDQASEVKKLVDEKLRYPFYARTWHDMHITLFRWMKIEKWLYTILLSLIILVAAFNIVSSQIMMVLEKRREIGILRAIGTSRKQIMRIFMLEGLIIGITGTILGDLLGYGLCWAQLKYRFFSLPGDVYFLSSLPVKMEFFDFVLITLVSLILTLLATVYPARRAGSLDPVDTIRYE